MTEFSNRDRAGVPKDKMVLIGLVATTRGVLMRHLLYFPIDAISFSSKYTDQQTTMALHRESLLCQFENYRSTATGSASGKAHGGNDDLIIAFMMALYWMTVFASSYDDVYTKFKSRYRMTDWELSAVGTIVRTERSVEKTNHDLDVIRV